MHTHMVLHDRVATPFEIIKYSMEMWVSCQFCFHFNLNLKCNQNWTTTSTTTWSSHTQKKKHMYWSNYLDRFDLKYWNCGLCHTSTILIIYILSRTHLYLFYLRLKFSRFLESRSWYYSKIFYYFVDFSLYISSLSLFWRHQSMLIKY